MKITRRLLSLLVCCASLRAGIVRADEAITIGFPEFDKTMNVLTSAHPAAGFLRRAVTGRLADPGPNNNLRMLLSDSMTTSPDRMVWSFRISPVATFSDRMPVLASDVEYSLARCRDAGTLPGVGEVTSEVLSDSNRSAQWVRIRLSSQDADVTSKLPQHLAACPILEARASRIFGKDLGAGTNIVSAGEYAFADLKAGREIVLKRMRPASSHTVQSGADRLSLRSFKDSSAALAALRAGTIDAFLSQDQAVIDRAKKDETLLAQQCPIYTVILRKGLSIACPDNVIASEIRYLS